MAKRGSELSRLPTIGIAVNAVARLDLGEAQRRPVIDLAEAAGDLIIQAYRLRNADEVA